MEAMVLTVKIEVWNKNLIFILLFWFYEENKKGIIN